MSKVKCYSVRLQSLESISEKAYRATAWDGSEDIIPKSQVFGQDWDVQKSDAYWIAAWILEKKSLQYSSKKEGWFNPATGRMEPKIEIERHVPPVINKKVEPIAGDDWLKLTYIPCVVLEHDMSKRLGATVQFNKARGVHKIDLNAELVKRMVELGVKDIDICKQLGMDADEVLRLKRNVKIADVYAGLQYSRSWEVDTTDTR